jgi:hypothetical protein
MDDYDLNMLQEIVQTAKRRNSDNYPLILERIQEMRHRYTEYELRGGFNWQLVKIVIRHIDNIDIMRDLLQGTEIDPADFLPREYNGSLTVGKVDVLVSMYKAQNPAFPYTEWTLLNMCFETFIDNLFLLRYSPPGPESWGYDFIPIYLQIPEILPLPKEVNDTADRYWTTFCDYLRDIYMDFRRISNNDISSLNKRVDKLLIPIYDHRRGACNYYKNSNRVQSEVVWLVDQLKRIDAEKRGVINDLLLYGDDGKNTKPVRPITELAIHNMIYDYLACERCGTQKLN